MHSKIVLAGLAMVALSACATAPQPTSQALIATVSGTVAPATLATNVAKDPRVASLTAAGIKPLAPPAVDAYMDLQEAELRKALGGMGVTITRVGDQIALVLPTDATFAAGDAKVKSGADSAIVAISDVVRKYNQTIVDVYGYTDNASPDAYNRDLSQRRAVAVATLLANGGVDQRRFFIEGRGSADPAASDATEAGRAQNRRVQIQIAPLASG